MYLKNIVIKNIGPIEEFTVELPFKENGDPKPVIFVGENGSGKTILISHIVNFFMSLKSVGFENNELKKGKVFKMRSPGYIKSGKEFYFSKIALQNQDFYSVEWQLKTIRQEFEKNKDPNQDYDELNRVSENESSVFYPSFQDKKDEAESLFNQNCCLYYPSNRFENPAWLNSEDWLHIPTFEDPETITGRTKRKIIQQKPLLEIKNWFMDLLFDQNVYEITQFPVQMQGKIIMAWTYKEEGRNKIIRDQISEFLNTLFGEDEKKLRLGFGPKNSRNIAVMEGNIERVPNIFNLSTGQLCLLDIFAGIIRDYDLSGAELKEIRDIRGIVIIDEIDLHLHTKLQSGTLPHLIKLFPKIQFIITTHSPLFLLGMKKTFSEEGFEVRNMPTGEKITTERFSEFENAYSVLKETEKFEHEVKSKVIANNKPIVYVEGPTDVKYLKKAYELYGKACDDFDIEIIGEITKFGAKNSNNDALSNAHKLLSTNINLLKQKVILLNDPEENIEEKEYQKLLFIRKMPQFTQNPLKKGIENLFEQSFIDKVKAGNVDFFQFQTVGTEIKNVQIVEGKKQIICDWICQNGTKDDFRNFEKIFEIIESVVSEEKKESE